MKLIWTHKNGHVYGPDDFPEDIHERSKGLLKPTLFEIYLTAKEFEVKHIYGFFTFSTLEGNCGIVVSSGTWITALWRNQGSANRLQEIKEFVARELGYSLMLSTVISTNVPQIVSASKAKWRFICNFLNKRTNNTCLLGVKHLK